MAVTETIKKPGCLQVAKRKYNVPRTIARTGTAERGPVQEVGFDVTVSATTSSSKLSSAKSHPSVTELFIWKSSNQVIVDVKINREPGRSARP